MINERTMTPDEESRHERHEQLLNELDDVAREYLELEQGTDSLTLAARISKSEAQVRFVRTVVAGNPDGGHDELGEAWITAGRRLLEPLRRRVEDEQHEARIARRVEL